MTTKSEDLKQGFASGGRVPKTILRQPNIKNLHTDDWEIELYNKDRTPYEGKFEIVLKIVWQSPLMVMNYIINQMASSLQLKMKQEFLQMLYTGRQKKQDLKIS